MPQFPVVPTIPVAQSSESSVATTTQITSVASATSSTQLLAANTSRKGMSVFNESTATLYLAFAGSASITAYSVQIPTNAFFEMPASPTYTGAIFGIWSAANGNARLTEFT